jgi:hypothetical protein
MFHSAAPRLRLFGLAIVPFAAIALQSPPAEARYCITLGELPMCPSVSWECPRNFVEVARIRSGCFAGARLRCCERMAHISQSQKKAKQPLRVPSSYGPSILKKNRPYKSVRVPSSYGPSTVKKNRSYKGIFR